jgi:hypothetical protein
MDRPSSFAEYREYLNAKTYSPHDGVPAMGYAEWLKQHGGPSVTEGPTQGAAARREAVGIMPGGMVDRASTAVANKVRELAPVPLAALDTLASTAMPGTPRGQVMALGEASGAIAKPTAPAPAPDAPTEMSPEVSLGSMSDSQDTALPVVKGGAGMARGPMQDGTDQESRHEVAGRAVDPGAKQKYEQAFGQQMRAVDQQAEAAGHESSAREDFYKRQLGEHDRVAREAEALARAKQAKVQEFDDRVKDRLAEENSDGAMLGKMAGQFISGIGLALGAWAASTTGGPNHALAIYKQHVDERAADLARRAKDEDNLYARMYRSFGDKEQALAATRAALNERGALELAKIEATAKTEYAKAAAGGLKAKILEQRGHDLDSMAAIEAPKIETSLARTRAHFLGGPDNPLRQGAPPPPAAPPPPDQGDALSALVAAREEAGADVARPKLGGWFPTSEQMDVAAHPDGPPPPAQATAPEARAPSRAPAAQVAAPAPPAQAAAPRTVAQERMLKRAELAQLARTNPKLITAAQEQLREHAQKNGKDIEALEGAIAFERSWPTGKPYANNEGFLGTATVKAVDALEAISHDEKAGTVQRMAAREAAAAAFNRMSPEDHARYTAWKAIRASFIRANAGATLSQSEKEMYDGLVGSYDVRRMMEFYQVHLKPKIAAKWNADSLGLSREANLMREIHGVPTEVKPNAPWSSYTARTQ